MNEDAKDDEELEPSPMKNQDMSEEEDIDMGDANQTEQEASNTDDSIYEFKLVGNFFFIL